MNRAATAGALLALFTGIVSAQDGGYFGIGAGRSTYDTQINANRAVECTYDEIPLAPLDPGGSISEAARDSDGSNKDDAWKLYGGYRFNRHFAVEGAYVDLNRRTLPSPARASCRWVGPSSCSARSARPTTATSRSIAGQCRQTRPLTQAWYSTRMGAAIRRMIAAYSGWAPLSTSGTAMP